jgi:CCR4-NOT transcriptional regulation complex NOT5 subunit
VVPAKAAPGLIQEIRTEIAWLEAKWVHLDQILRDINEEISQVRGKLLAARRLISAGKSNLGSLVKQYLEAAIQEKDVIISVKFEEFNDFLIFIDEELGELLGKIEAASEEGKLHPRKEEKIKSLVLSIEKLVEAIQLDGAEMEALLEDGDFDEDMDDPETFDDVNDWIEYCLENQIANGFNDYTQCSESLGRALQLLDEFIAIKASLYKKKKLAVKRLITVKKLMLSTGAPKVRKVDALSRARAVQIYTLQGQLVASASSTNELSRLGLPNGVYLAVREVTDASGTVRQELTKFTIAR